MLFKVMGLDPITLESEYRKRRGPGTSLAVQQLELCAFTAKGPGSIPGGGTKIPKAVLHDQKKREREKRTKPLGEFQEGHFNIKCLGKSTNKGGLRRKNQRGRRKVNSWVSCQPVEENVSRRRAFPTVVCRALSVILPYSQVVPFPTCFCYNIK